MFSAPFFTASFLGNSVLQYLTSLVILAFGGGAVLFADRVAVRRLKDDFLVSLVDKTIFPLLMYGVFYVSLNSLSVNPGIDKIVRVAGIILFTLLAVRFVMTVFQFAVFSYWLPRRSNHDVLEYQLKGLMPALSVFVWGMAVIFLLDNLGFKISTVIAGLGIGGVALALASQTVLGDLFSYFAILFDKPFVIGDFIVVGDLLGTVEHIGVKTTRISSLGGEQLVFGNKELTSATIRNFKRMRKRRVVFNLAVDFETESAQLREIPQLLRGIVTGLTSTAFDRAHFSAYGPGSLNFEIVYFVLTDDYNVYMDIQQEINLRIKDEFERRKIKFAYPTQKLYLKKENHPLDFVV